MLFCIFANLSLFFSVFVFCLRTKRADSLQLTAAAAKWNDRDDFCAKKKHKIICDNVYDNDDDDQKHRNFKKRNIFLIVIKILAVMWNSEKINKNHTTTTACFLGSCWLRLRPCVCVWMCGTINIQITRVLFSISRSRRHFWFGKYLFSDTLNAVKRRERQREHF